jgi:D-alanine-D-alanine ligase
MKSQRVMLLVHDRLQPVTRLLSPEERLASPFKTEYDILHNLRAQGHQVLVVGVSDDLKVIRQGIEDFKPHVVFNLLEEFAGEAIYDQNVVSYLELMRMRYTGCNPRGLILARDKALTKEILAYHRIKVPRHAVFPKFRPIKRNKELEFPLIVKCLSEEASLGISQASVVDNDQKLRERVEYLHKTYHVDVIAESFVQGREFYVGVIGNYRLETLPIWELRFDKDSDPDSKFATTRVKFNETYRKQHKIEYGQAVGLTKEETARIQEVCKRVYRHIKLSGYARIDLRMTPKGEIYVIEANPNPDIAIDEEFAESAYAAGYSYGELLDKILSLA